MNQANTAARKNMALGQLYTNQVLDRRLLTLLTEIPREAFVPEHLAGAAYADDDLDIGNGRVLLEPLVFARLVVLAEPDPQAKALVLPCALGYPAAVLSRLCAEVVAVESVKTYADEARTRLQYMGAANVKAVHIPDISAGYAAGAPYDIIFINGGIERVPAALEAQLAENGRLVAVQYFAPRAGLAYRVGKIVQHRKINGALFHKETMDAATPILPEFRTPAAFIF